MYDFSFLFNFFLSVPVCHITNNNQLLFDTWYGFTPVKSPFTPLMIDYHKIMMTTNCLTPATCGIIVMII